MARAKKKAQGRRSSRPQILRFRWRLLTRSPRWTQLTVLFLAIVAFLGLALLRRPSASREAPRAPVASDS